MMNNITDEMLHLALQRYPPGTRYINPAAIIDDRDLRKAVIDDNNNSMLRHHRKDNKVGIIPAVESGGFVYLDGLWADIIDGNDNIIQSFNLDFSLEKARSIIYKE